MNKKILAFAFISILFLSTWNIGALAQNKYAVSIDAGTTGIGLDGVVRLHERVNARVGFHTISYSSTATVDDLDVGLDAVSSFEVSNISAMVDYFPFKRFVKLSAGLYYVLNFNFDGTITPNEDYEMDGRMFSPDRLGYLNANLNYSNGISPYLGIGFGNAVGKGWPVKFNMNIGMIYTGAPNLNMEGEGMIAPTADNAESFQTGLNEFKWYPVLNVGISYAFIKVSN